MVAIYWAMGLVLIARPSVGVPAFVHKRDGRIEDAGLPEMVVRCIGR